ncbi:MAG: hypothetical protein AB9866_23740 [Syntrophobacteraceae bacterium]
MDSGLFSVSFEGRLREGFSREEAEARFSKLFRLSAERAAQLLSGPPLVIRKGLSFAEAEKYRIALEHAGLVCSISRDSAGPEHSDPTDVPIAAGEEAPLGMQDSKQVCPKCGYEMTGEGSDNSDECMKCGVIISKYLRTQAENRVNSAEGPAAPDTSSKPACQVETVKTWFAEPSLLSSLFGLELTLSNSIVLPKDKSQYRAAPLKLRLYAAIASLGMVSFATAILQIPLIVYLLFTALIGVQSKLSIEEAKSIRAILSLAASVYLFVFLPIRWHGLTYGQRLMGLWVAPKSETAVWPAMPRILLRAIGNLLNSMTCGLLGLIWLKVIKGESISDTFSGTSQYEAGTMPPRPLITALKPFGYVFGMMLIYMVSAMLIMPFAASYAKKSHVDPPSQSTRIQMRSPLNPGWSGKTNTSQHIAHSQSISPREVLEKLAAMQQKYYEGHQEYCREIEVLLAMYGPGVFPSSDPLFKMPYSNNLLLNAREKGFEMRLKRGKKWYVISESGYMGERPGS